MGDTVIEAGRESEQIVYAKLDLAVSNQNKIVNVAGSYELDRLADRRPEFYGRISEPLSKSEAADA
jgi:hypothetical protein